MVALHPLQRRADIGRQFIDPPLPGLKSTAAPGADSAPGDGDGIGTDEWRMRPLERFAGRGNFFHAKCRAMGFRRAL